jgi:TonB family protein
LVREALGLARAPRVGVPAVQGTSRPGQFEETQPEFAAGDAEDVLVKFESEPPGATVRLDGELLCQASPCSKRVAAGRHEVTFEKERYAASRVAVVAARGSVVRGSLAPKFGWLDIETDVPGVSVILDGVDAGKTPLASREAGPGLVEVAVSDRCFMRTGERVLLGAGERRTVRLSARPKLAGLKVNAVDDRGNDLEGRVWVDGRDAGEAGAVLKVPVCSQQASVTLGSGEWRTSLRLEEGRVTVLEAKVIGSAGAGTGPREAVGIGPVAVKGGSTATQAGSQEAEVQARTTLETAEVESTTVDRDQLSRYVKSRLRAVTSCYEKELKRNPSLKGRVVVQFTIKPDGRTTDVNVNENTVGSDAVAQCIRFLIRAWTFPFKPEKEATVAYPFSFAPAN